MTIKRLFFDIDNTLFPTFDFIQRANENAIRAMIQNGLNCDEKRGIKLLENIFRKKGSNYSRHFNDLVRNVNGKEDLKIVAAGIMAHHNTKNSLSPYPEVPLTLLELHDMGYKLYVASEGVEIKQWDKLLRMGIENMFERVYVTKNKNLKFYANILSRNKFNPKDCVMIGDRPDKDIEPAMQAGMYTIRVRRGKYSSLTSKATKTVLNIRELPELIEKIDKLRYERV